MNIFKYFQYITYDKKKNVICCFFLYIFISFFFKIYIFHIKSIIYFKAHNKYSLFKILLALLACSQYSVGVIILTIFSQ